MRRLKVAYYTLKQHAEDGKLKNIGDRVIFLGVRNIMRCALGPHDEEICFLEDEAPIPLGTDILVICGMPQISISRPSQILNRIIELGQSDVPVKLNLGAGAFYFDAFGSDHGAADIAFSNALVSNPHTISYQNYAVFDDISCRDFAGVLALEKYGVTARALPCPGFFSAMFEPRPLLRSGQELVSVLNGTASFWDAVRADVHSFYRSLWAEDNSRIFISHDYQDSTMLADLGIPFVEFNDAEEFIRFLAGHDRILSLRVHGALPSWTLGLDVTLLGLDRRALLGKDFGAQMRIIPLRSEEDMRLAQSDPTEIVDKQDENFRRSWLLTHLSEYVDLIRKTVGRKLDYDFDFLGHDPLGGYHKREVEAWGGKMPPGRYFSELFHSRDSEFPIPLSQMRSSHQHEKFDDKIILTSNGKNSVLIFGPYIRIPSGLWQIETTVFSSMINAEEISLALTVSKGVPGLCLERQVQIGKNLASRCEISFCMVFNNPSDTGTLEFILSSNGILDEACEIELSALRLKKLDFLS